MQQAARHVGPVSPIASLNSKLVLLVLVPSLILAFVTIGSQRFLEDVGRQAIVDLTRSHDESRELSSATRSIRTQVTAFTQTLTHYLDRHEKTLLSAEWLDQDLGLTTLRAQASTLADVASQSLGLMRRSIIDLVDADRVMKSFDKHQTYIVRTANSLPKLIDILAESHDRTTAHLALNEFNRARTQYVYEEHARARALQTAVERLTGVLERLTVDVEGYITLKKSKAIARAQTDAGEAMSRTFWSIAATIIGAAFVAVLTIRLTVSRPIGNFVSTMLRLARGDLDIEIDGQHRKDEIGAVAKALGVFKAGAIERQKIEKDLADYREHLEELVETRTGEIEEQKVQIEEALHKERELNGLQRQFVAMVSHEFRTPLSIIDGNAQRLLRRLDSVPADRLEKALKTVRLSVHRLIDLMESVLSAARLENGQIRIDPKPCSLVGLIQEVSQSYLDLHPDRQIRLDLSGLPEMITADDKLIRQVISNIMSNAIKYSPDATEIWITGSIDEQGRAAVAIRDEGLGIPLAEQAKLFERFFRASTSMGIAGTGIGLNFASHLVQMHGGIVDFVSVEGEGTTFSIRLPIAGPSTAQETPDGCPADARTTDDGLLVETMAS